jgi:hypothetical protein
MLICKTLTSLFLYQRDSMRHFFLIALTGLLVAGCGARQDEVPAAVTVASMAAQRAQAALPKARSARFGGERASYDVAVLGENITVTEIATRLAVKVDPTVTRLQFADGVLVLDIEGVGGTVYRVYQAAFDRKPDMQGYAFWLGSADAGTPIDSIAGGFIQSGEFGKLYGTSPSNNDLLTRIYANVLHRQPDKSGFDFWINALNSGAISPSVLLASFADSAENKAQVLADIQSGIWVPSSPKLVATLEGGPAYSVGKTVIANISGVAPTSPAVKLGSTSLSVQKTGGQLIFAIPDVVAGSYQLAITAGGQTVNMPINVTATTLPASPRSYLKSELDKEQADIERMLATADATQAPLLTAIKGELARQQGVLLTADDATVRNAALSLAANDPSSLSLAGGTATSAQSHAQRYDLAKCETLIERFGQVAAGEAAARIYTLFARVLDGSKLQTGLNFLSDFTFTRQLILEQIVDECLVPDMVTLGFDSETSSISSPTGHRSAQMVTPAATSFAFVDKRTRNYRITEYDRASDNIINMVQSSTIDYATLLANVQSYVKWIGISLQPYIDKLAAFTGTRIRDGNASDYVLTGISDSRISGVVSPAGSKVGLNFSFKSGTSIPQDPVPFKFDIVHAETKKKLGTFSATLLGEPVIIDSIFTMSSKVTGVEEPEPISKTYSCGSGTCTSTLFCSPDDPIGSTNVQNLRITLDGEKSRATIYYEGETVIGTFSLQSGAVAAEVSFNDGVVQQSPEVTYYGDGSLKLNGIYDAKAHTISGTFISRSNTSWSLDGAVARCSATSTFTATEQGRIY